MDKKNLYAILLIIAVIILVPKNLLFAFLVFGLIVLVHEFGHYIVAKKSGIYVEEFAIGMGPKLLGFRKNETLYSIRVLPLGGFCKMLGEDEDLDDERAFNRKSVWKRLATILAGPIFNFILAFICAVFVISYIGYSTTRIDRVSPDTPAEAIFQEGDRIIKINGYRPLTYNELSLYIQLSNGKPMDVVFERDGVTHETVITPQLVLPFNLTEDMEVVELAPGLNGILQYEDQVVQIDDVYVTSQAEIRQYVSDNLGRVNTFELSIIRNNTAQQITVSAEDMVNTYQVGIQSGRVKGNFFNNVKAGFVETISWIKITLVSVVQLVSGNVSFKQIAGPVGLVSVISDSYQQAAQLGFLTLMLNLANMLVLLSANLGVFNLLPIPALDGGRTIFLLIEAVRGKPMDREKEGFIHFIGFALLMLLMIVVLFNDINNVFG